MKKNNIPALRFPQFNEPWTVKKLGEVTLIMQSGLSRKLDDNNIGLPVLRSNNIKNGIIDLDDLKYWYKNDPQGAKTENYYLRKNDILINFINSLTQIGKAAIVSEDFDTPTIYTTNILRLSVTKNVNPFFVYYNFNLNKYINYIQSITKPAINQASFTTADLKQFPISLPSLPEQQKIADFLSGVDEKIGQLERRLALEEQYKKGMMQLLFDQEIRFKDDNGNEFPDWEEKKLGEVLSIGSGRDYKHLNDGEVPVFGTGGLMTFVDDYLFDGETVCIGRKGTIDAPLYYSGKIWTVDTLFYTHSFKNSFPKYVYFQFLNINWKEYNEATGVPSLSKKTIERIPISLPSLPEQQKIADFLSSLDERIGQTKAELEKARVWKRGLMQRMFV